MTVKKAVEMVAEVMRLVMETEAKVVMARVVMAMEVRVEAARIKVESVTTRAAGMAVTVKVAEMAAGRGGSSTAGTRPCTRHLCSRGHTRQRGRHPRFGCWIRTFCSRGCKPDGSSTWLHCKSCNP